MTVVDGNTVRSIQPPMVANDNAIDEQVYVQPRMVDPKHHCSNSHLVYMLKEKHPRSMRIPWKPGGTMLLRQVNR